MNEDVVTLGAIGLGGLAQRELALCEELDNVDIVAGADPAADGREAFTKAHGGEVYQDCTSLLNEHGDALDAVTIVTPHTLHFDQAMEALDYDLDIFLEKPMVTDISDAVQLVDRINATDQTLQVGYQRHFHPAYQKIKALIDDGAIGDLHTVNCFLGQDWIRRFDSAWRSNPDLSGGGQLYDSGSHLLDTLLWTTGTLPQTVAATMDYRQHECDVNSSLAIELERNGNPVTASVSVTADGTSTSGTEEGLFIWGTDGRLSFTKSGLTRHGKGEGERDTAEKIPVETDPSFEMLAQKKLENFFDAVRANDEPAVSGEYGLQVTALTEAAYRAADSGQRAHVQHLIDTARSETVQSAQVEGDD
ncbi:Gfo/Idh/MocA family protein [Halorussus salinisoli]|uniref:Gfo/Idh/MocA family protein n=1 Tax=Halorussus salinisoli TaxID=2558242 RepID=UPI0010C1C937|nr:Gfo/Idh/MocA family oxidoreductase [Halorussus salinisoli]